MSWVYQNGIRVWIQDGATIGDYHGLITTATSDMIQFRETWGDDPFFAIRRSGDLYRLERINGEDRVIMGPVPQPGKPPRKLPEEPPEPSMRYCPAFHACDSEGTVVGLLVCLSGKWGPPYRFIQASESDLIPFAYGQWNTWYKAERPPEEENRPQLLEGSMTFDELTGDELAEDVWDLPAVHEYITDHTQWVSINQSSANYLGGVYYEICMCTETEAHGLRLRDATQDRVTQETNTIFVMSDWSADEEGLPAIRTHYEDHHQWGDFTMACGSSHTYAETSGACANMMESLAEIDNDGPVLDGDEPYMHGTAGYDGQAERYGEYPWSLGGTMYDTVPGAGLYLYALDYMNSYLRQFWVKGVEDCHAEQSDSDSWANYWSTENVNFMGTDYKIKDLTVDYYASDQRIHESFPRLYWLSETEGFGLVSLSRRDIETVEYWSFRNGYAQCGEQYDDPAFTCKWLASDRHDLNGETAVVDGQEIELFGNYEFSLVRIEEEPM